MLVYGSCVTNVVVMYSLKIDAAFDWWNVASLSGVLILSSGDVAKV